MTSKTALVTGASRGIGLGIATRLAKHGYSLTLSSRDARRLGVAADSLRAAGSPRVVAVPGDIADPEVSRRLVDTHREHSDALHALILNAGVGTAGAIADYPAKWFGKTINVNLRAPLMLLQATLPMLRLGAEKLPRTGAKVIALASITGVYAERNLAVYGATKAALISLIETFNAEESENGVSATALAPGYVDTEMSAWTRGTVPAETMIRVEDIVEITDALLNVSAASVIPKIVIHRAGAKGYGA